METIDTKLDLGTFDFTPDWARKEAGVTVGKTSPVREDAGRRPFGDRREGNKAKPQGDRRPFSDRKPQGPRKPFGERRPRFEERPRPLECDVKILPDTKALGTIIRKLQQDYHAYKLKDLAYFFLDNPESILLKVTPKKTLDAEGKAVEGPALKFHQCKACSFASTKPEDVVEHVLAAHLGDYYDAKEIEVEPPKGNFSCVAKCGLSGVLLGPPNAHEFNANVREMIRTRYPDMSEQEYRSRIVMVREAEAIEEWRKSAVKKTVFTAKGAAEGAPTLTREQAEGEFRRTILPNLLDEPKALMISAAVALNSPVKPLVWAVRDALEAERRAPYAMIYALRGAFHHRKMTFFRANDSRGPEFVVGHELKEFDTAHAIPELAEIAKFIAENPCEPKVVIAGEDAEKAKHLDWLASTGHIVAFTNGVYSPVEKNPKYGPQWQKKAKKVAEKEAAVVGKEAVVVEEKAQEPNTEEPKVEEPKAEEPAAAPVEEEKKEEVKNETPAELA